MSIPAEIQEAQEQARDQERKRIIGIILAAYGIYRLNGEHEIAKALDWLALRIEHPDAAEL